MDVTPRFHHAWAPRLPLCLEMDSERKQLNRTPPHLLSVLRKEARGMDHLEGNTTTRHTCQEPVITLIGPVGDPLMTAYYVKGLTRSGFLCASP